MVLGANGAIGPSARTPEKAHKETDALAASVNATDRHQRTEARNVWVTATKWPTVLDMEAGQNGLHGRPALRLAVWPSRPVVALAVIRSRPLVAGFVSVPIVMKSTVPAIRLAQSRASHPSMVNGPIGATGANAPLPAEAVSAPVWDAATVRLHNTVEPIVLAAASNTRHAIYIHALKPRKSHPGHLGSWPTTRTLVGLNVDSVSRVKRQSTWTYSKSARWNSRSASVTRTTPASEQVSIWDSLPFVFDSRLVKTAWSLVTCFSLL